MKIRWGRRAEAVPTARTETVIDLRERRRQREFGRPTRCPKCQGVGYLDYIDLVKRSMRQHCRVCSHEWTTTESELLAEVEGSAQA